MCINRASDARIPVWAPKLCAETKEKLIQKTSGISSNLQHSLPFLGHLSKIHKKVELQTLSMCTYLTNLFLYYNVLFV